ncbi:MAG: AI-2E family transporter [Sodalis sp. (in: enterobacteria)]|uniref:AI-2E family transporter n=1 Tax=Sodalis sp. (in: enterobacteria) TaxID=1898979 RepID=UPI003F2C2AE7
MEKSALSPYHAFTHLACATLLTLGIYLASPVLIPLLVALCLALVLMRPINRLARLRVPRRLAVIAVTGSILLALLVTLGIIMAALPELRQMSAYIPLLLTDKLQAVPAFVQSAGMTLTVESLWATIDPAQLVTIATRTVGRITGMLTAIAMVFMLVVFMLLEAPALSVKCRILLQEPSPQWTALQQSLDCVTRYLALKTVISLFIGLAVLGRADAAKNQIRLYLGRIGFRTEFYTAGGIARRRHPAPADGFSF